MFTLSQYRAILYLDTDLAVLRNLDHILEDMLESWPLLAQARTPQACRTLDHPEGDDRLREEALDRWNTGVWAVQPSNAVFRSLVNFLQNGSNFRCNIGFQGAATTFFNRQGRYIKTKPEDALRLHVGYNLKPDVLSVQKCLARQGLNRSHVHVVHWSGDRKPWDVTPGHEPVEARALWLYMTSFCRHSMALNSSMPAKGAQMCRVLRGGEGSLLSQFTKENYPTMNQFGRFLLKKAFQRFLKQGASEEAWQSEPHVPRPRSRRGAESTVTAARVQLQQ